MKELLQQLISDLVEENTALESILLKAKVIAHKIDNNSFKEWIDKELNGYSSSKDLPEYRKQPGQIMGTLINRVQRINNTVIPISHLDPETIDELTKVNLFDSLTGIEYCLKENESGTLTVNLSPEVCAIINKNIPLASGFRVQFAHIILSASCYKEIITIFKSRLLEFILELEKEFELNLDFKTIKKEEQKVNEMVQHIIHGNNNVLVSGSKNETHVNYNVSKNNIEELKTEFIKNGIQNEDLIELDEILPNEYFDTEKSQFGPRTKTWLAKMTNKAIEGTWEIGINAATQLLTGCLSKYYGV